jgi:hypothetical protein
VRWRLVGPVSAVVVALVAGVLLTRPDDGEATAAPDPVAVSSDAPRLGSLEELVAASDLVVRAEVVATEPGRVFGEPGGTAVESRLVTLEVGEVLSGTAPRDDTVLVEEEGWLDDGTPLIVDGAAPSRTGDDGIWFLVDVGDPDAPVHVVVSAQGRYLVDGDGLVGAAGDDRLIAALARLSVDELAARIAALPPSSP